MKNIKIVEKLLISILAILMLFNFIFSACTPTIVWAAPTDPPESQTDPNTDPDTDPDNSGGGSTKDTIFKMVTDIGDAIGGIVSAPVEWIRNAIISTIVGAFSAAQLAIYSVAGSAGVNGDVNVYITPLDIFFNKFALTDINIFSTQTSDGTQLDSDNLVYKIRTNAAMWYYVFRAVSIGILLIVLFVTLIRILSNSSTIKQKAQAKQSITDWLVSLVLVMFMHLLIIFVITLNNTFVGILEGAANNTDLSDLTEAIRNVCFSENYIMSMAGLIVYVLLIFQTIKYLLVYILRFLTTLFLMIISPIVPITYAREKANGGRAIALNGWLREFLYNVFIQLIHCVIYIVMVSTAMEALQGQTSVTGLDDLAGAIIAIIAMFFIGTAEKLLREIFGFNKSTTLVSNTNAVNKVTHPISTAAGAVQRTRQAFGMGVPGMPAQGISFGQDASTAGANTGNMFGDGLRNAVGQAKNFGNSVAESLGLRNNNNNNNSNNEYNDYDDSQGLDDNDNLLENGENNSGEENGDTSLLGGMGAIPLPLGMGTNPDELSKDIAEKVNSENSETERSKKETLENIISKLHKEKDETKIVEEVPAEQDVEENFESDIVVDAEDPELLDEFKDKFAEIEESNRIVQEWGNDVDKKLDELNELRDQLSDKEAEDIENTMDNMNSSNEMNAYIDSLGQDTAAGKYAAAYKDFMAYSQLDDEITDRKQGLIDEYRGKGLNIGEDLGNSLMTYHGMDILGRLKASSVKQPKTDTESSEIEHVEGDILDADGNVILSGEEKASTEVDQDIVDVVDSVKDNTSVQNAAKDALKTIDLIRGKVDVDGDISDATVTDFMLEITNKMSKKSFNTSNIREAERKVREAGEDQVRAVQRFNANPNAQNAALLGPAAQEYAILQQQAKAANVVVTQAAFSQTRMEEHRSDRSMISESRNISSSSNDTINQMRQQRLSLENSENQDSQKK